MAAPKKKGKKQDGKLSAIFPIERETKRFIRYGVPDDDGDLPFNAIYVRKGSLPEGTESITVTVESNA